MSGRTREQSSCIPVCTVLHVVQVVVCDGAGLLLLTKPVPRMPISETSARVKL